MSETVQFRVIGTPRTKGSYRAMIQRRKGGGEPFARLVPSESDRSARELRAWGRAVKAAAKTGARGNRFEDPDTALAVRILFRLERPISVRRRFPSRKGADLDKLVRAVLDSITEAGVWADDSQVVSLRTSKIYAAQGEQPGADVEISQLVAPAPRGPK